MKTQKVTKAVIAAAGFGSRFLPQTKAMPKEMLPLIDKPVIQYVVEELVEAGIEDIIIVTGYHKRSIEDHFDHMSADLRENLKLGGKHEILEETKKISDLANFAYVRQKGPYGNATPIMNVRHLIGDEPFIYTYADDLIVAQPNHFKQLISTHNDLGGSVLPCLPITDDEGYSRYGIVAGTPLSDGPDSIIKMDAIIEKPGKSAAPSNLASIGGYLLGSEIFSYLESAYDNFDGDGEFQVQPIMQRMINSGESLHALPMKQVQYYDTGNKLEYLKTVAEFALNHPELGSEFEAFLRKRLS